MFAFDTSRRSSLVALFAGAIAWPSAAWSQDKPAPIVPRPEILYEPNPKIGPIDLTRTRQLVAPGAGPDKVDCVVVLSKRPPADLTLHVDDLTAQISAEISARYERLLNRKVPVGTKLAFEGEGEGIDHHAKARERGFAAKGAGSVKGTDYTVYMRAGYPREADFGLARAIVTLTPTALIDARGHARLVVAHQIRWQSMAVPDGADRDKLGALQAAFTGQVENDVKALVAGLERTPTILDENEKERFRGGAGELLKPVPFQWDGQPKAFEMTVRARLGRTVFEVVGGNF